MFAGTSSKGGNELSGQKDTGVDVLGRKGVLQSLPGDAGFRRKDDGRHPEAVLRSLRLWVHGNGVHACKLLAIGVEDFSLAIDQLADALDLREADGGLQVRHLVFEADLVRPELLFCPRARP